MKFIKGMMLGTLVSAGIIMAYNDSMMNGTKKKMVKMGRQWAKKLGMI